MHLGLDGSLVLSIVVSQYCCRSFPILVMSSALLGKVGGQAATAKTEHERNGGAAEKPMVVSLLTQVGSNRFWP
jgi:hypothetical protein